MGKDEVVACERTPRKGGKCSQEMPDVFDVHGPVGGPGGLARGPTARIDVSGPLPLLDARLGWDPCQMKKALIFVAVLAGVGGLVKRFAPELGKMDWEKRFEAMPDNAPPKWMFRNITAIRDNTDRILELLEGRSAEDAVSGLSNERGAGG